MKTTWVPLSDSYIINIPVTIFSILIFATGILFFSYIIFRRFLPLRAAAPDPRFNHLGKRLMGMLKFGFGQYRQPRYMLSGILHITIFVGFLALSIRSLTLVAIGICGDFYFPGFEGSLGEGYNVFKDFMALLVLIACLVAMIRRGIFKPERYAVTPELGKGHHKEAIVILGMISVLLLADMFFEATLLIGGGAYTFPGPGTWVTTQLLDELSLSVLHKIHLSSYFIHDLMFFAFLCMLPLGKHFHVLTGLLNVFLMKLDMGNVKPIIWGLSEEQLQKIESYGVKKLEDFTWKHILDFYTCADCGRCSDQCPANASGAPLSPRFISIKCRDYCYERYPVIGKAVESQPLIGNILSDEEVWSCTTCGACEAECPLFIEYIDKIVDLRRGLLDEGNVPSGIQEVLENISEDGNSFAEPEGERANWCHELDFPIKNINQEKAEYLWFVGDFASYDARAINVSRSFAKILKQLDVDYSLAYDIEKNSGNDVRRIGEEGLFEELCENNMDFLKTEQFTKVITTDPHTFNALKVDYPDLNKNIEHYTEFLLAQIKKANPKISRKLNYKVIYHDSCYLGRYHGIYQAPRELLRLTGVELVEMERNKSRSFCCGGGGGGIWMDEREDVEKISMLRVKQALELDADILVVSCPKCLVMFEDALKSIENTKGLIIKDLIELLLEALIPIEENQKGG